MIVHDVEQGSPAWLAARLGVPTSSEFHRIVTPTGKLSSQAGGYMHRLIAEAVLNKPLLSLEGLEWIERGKELEPQAARMYEFDTEAQTAVVGFITTDDGRMGCSPDRLIVGQPGGLEIKCPAPQTHIGYMLEGFGKDYQVQVQGQMLVTGWEWVDRYSFHPEMPPVRVRTPRNDAFIVNLRGALEEFCDNLAAAMEKVRAAGFFARREEMKTAADQAYEEEWFGGEDEG